MGSDSMEKKPIAIVLGGTVPHIGLIELLKGEGYSTVLVDYYENPPAKHAADIHIQESTLDFEEVLRIAKEKKAELVVALCVDQANVTASYVSEKLGLPKLYSYETSLDVTDKGRMKKIMKENRIPTSTYVVVNDSGKLNLKDLNYPLVVKPVDSNGSKGVKKINTSVFLDSAIQEAMDISRAKRVIVEEFKEGDEIQVDCIVKNKKTEILSIKKRLRIPNQEGNAMQSYGSIIPVELPETIEKEIERIADRIPGAFGFSNAPFFFQAIVNKEDISVIELAPRIGGSLSTLLIEKVAGFDILKSSLNFLLGKGEDVAVKRTDRLYVTNILYAEEGVFDRLSGVDALLADGTIEYFLESKTKGMHMGKSMDSGNRVGCILIAGKSDDELAEKSKEAIERLEAYDIDGKPILRKELFYRGRQQ